MRYQRAASPNCWNAFAIAGSSIARPRKAAIIPTATLSSNTSTGRSSGPPIADFGLDRYTLLLAVPKQHDAPNSNRYGEMLTLSVEGTGTELDFGQFWQRAGERSLQGKQIRP
jgi:hypothetical protein